MKIVDNYNFNFFKFNSAPKLQEGFELKKQIASQLTRVDIFEK